MLELPPLGLYVHIPWCLRKCPYCDFNSHEHRGGAIPEREYLERLCADLEEELARSPARLIETVFFGGGTPSLFEPASFARLLAMLRTSGRLAPGAEITLEANPGTAEAGRFAGYREAGVNRLSLGVQSFDDAALARLGRVHGGAEARAALAMARQAGFANINIDLMFGLPRQDHSAALADLATAIDFEPDHVSWYQLTLEPNTWFWRRPPRLPPDEAIEAMHDSGIGLLAKAGFEHYEVSAFARPGRECRHNANYWQFGDYLGIGAGAHGKLTEPASNRIFRTRKTKQPKHFLDAANRTALRDIAQDERALEFLMNALRLRRGFASAQFESRTGLSFGAVEERLECLAGRRLLELDGGRVRASDRGYRLLDSILGEFT